MLTKAGWAPCNGSIRIPLVGVSNPPPKSNDPMERADGQVLLTLLTNYAERSEGRSRLANLDDFRVSEDLFADVRKASLAARSRDDLAELKVRGELYVVKACDVVLVL